MTRLAFDGRLYPRAAVERAVADHAEAADLALTEEGGVLIVEVRALRGELAFDEFEGEFSNYVLGVIGA